MPKDDDRRGWASHLFQDLVLLAEVIARQLVKVGAGDTDDPGLLLVLGRVDHARTIGASLANTEAVLARHRQLVVLVAHWIDSPPLGHVGDRLGVAIDRPR